MKTLSQQVAEIATLVIRDEDRFFGTRQQAVEYTKYGIENGCSFQFIATNQNETIPEITETEVNIRSHYTSEASL
jgi:hypothetical protein